jgi:hypothetical protein
MFRTTDVTPAAPSTPLAPATPLQARIGIEDV